MAEPGTPSVLRDSGIEHTQLSWEGLQLCEITGLRLTGWRCHPGAGSIPREWPRQVGAVQGDDPALCCLRPGEWLQIGAGSDGPGAPPPGMVRIDRSHGFGIFRVSGPAAPWLLAQLGALDHLALVHIKRARIDQTRMGHARVLLLTRPVAEPRGGHFEVLVDRSLARYLWERLVMAAPHAVRQSTAGKARGNAQGIGAKA